MKIYFAAGAPGNEHPNNMVGMVSLPNRLLSYYLIKNKILECHIIFKRIKKYEKK